MNLLGKLGYVALDVADLDSAVAFYEGVIHLEVSDRRETVAFMRGGNEHHWFRLHRSLTPGVRRVGYRATSEAAMDEICSRLEARGIAWTVAGSFSEERVERAIRFEDPDGFPVEVFNEMIEFPTPRFNHFVEFDNLCHAVLNVSDLRQSVRSYEEVLGFKVSDWVEYSGAFMRCGDGYHHSLALLDRPEFAGTLDHICMNLKSIDDVMRGRAMR